MILPVHLGDCILLFLRVLPAQIIEYYNPSGPPPPPPPPMIPSAQTAFVSPLQIPAQPPFPASAGSTYPAPSHQPSTGLLATAPPPPGPPPPPPGPPGPSSLSSSPLHGPPVAEAKRPEPTQPPINDARSDLLAAIRMGKCTPHVTISLLEEPALGLGWLHYPQKITAHSAICYFLNKLKFFYE